MKYIAVITPRYIVILDISNTISNNSGSKKILALTKAVPTINIS